jgi:1-acyl-sn-glycerol-3-phosphate acyltransferase
MSTRNAGREAKSAAAAGPGNGPAATARPAASGVRAPQDPVGRFIARRVAAAMTSDGPNETFMRTFQKPVWDFLCDHYFRLDIDGWHRIPDEPSLLIGIHGGGSLTMDAWTLVHAWYRHFEGKRILHGTAHDVLMAAPVLGDYFKAVGVIPASRRGVTAALAAGHDVVIWPGGEQDAMRSWRKRDRAVLAGRKGFVRQAIRSGVPIVPVATIGGHDTVFVLSEGRFIARWTGLGKRLRGATIPIIAGFPFPLAVEILPAHIPLPAKIRTEFLDPIYVDSDPARADDTAYVDSIYSQVETAIQDGMDRLAKRRSFPIFG